MSEPEKRHAILQAALELIAERGLHDTPMSLVAKHSGSSAGTIYHYFADKEDLIHALYRHVKLAFNRALVAGVEPDLTHAEAFKRMWLNAYYYYFSHLTEARFLDQYENSPYYHPHFPTSGVIDEEVVPELYHMVFGDADERLTRDLPLDALYELSIGVAARVAKHRTGGLPPLDEATLTAIADACYQAVCPEVSR